MALEFVDEPTSGGRARPKGWRDPQDTETVGQLKKKRGKWAVWPETFDTPRQAYTFAHLLKRRFPGVQAVGRTGEDGEGVVYARWLGVK